MRHQNNFKNKRGTWSYNIKHVLQEIGQHESFETFSTIDMGYAKSVLIDSDSDDWDNRRYRSDKLRYYNLYKGDKNCADYLKMNITKYQRSLFAQFRSGILPLEIEVGRYRNIDLSERICKLCDLNMVEDEIHFLCVCPLYTEERGHLFSKVFLSNSSFSNLDSFDKFVYLMSNHERSVVTFLSTAFRKRQTYISTMPVNIN